MVERVTGYQLPPKVTAMIRDQVCPSCNKLTLLTTK